MSKVHEDNAGYVGVSYEETQDPFFSYNKLALPLSKQAIRRSPGDETTFTVSPLALTSICLDGTSTGNCDVCLKGIYIPSIKAIASNGSHPLKFSYTADGTHGAAVLNIRQGVTTNGTPGQVGAYTRLLCLLACTI